MASLLKPGPDQYLLRRALRLRYYGHRFRLAESQMRCSGSKRTECVGDSGRQGAACGGGTKAESEAINCAPIDKTFDDSDF